MLRHSVADRTDGNVLMVSPFDNTLEIVELTKLSFQQDYVIVILSKKNAALSPLTCW